MLERWSIMSSQSLMSSPWRRETGHFRYEQQHQIPSRLHQEARIHGNPSNCGMYEALCARSCVPIIIRTRCSPPPIPPRSTSLVFSLCLQANAPSSPSVNPASRLNSAMKVFVALAAPTRSTNAPSHPRTIGTLLMVPPLTRVWGLCSAAWSSISAT